jgi:hypothetical protein
VRLGTDGPLNVPSIESHQKVLFVAVVVAVAGDVQTYDQRN